jgi:hypothetical protein
MMVLNHAPGLFQRLLVGGQAVNFGVKKKENQLSFHPTVAQASLPAREEQSRILVVKGEKEININPLSLLLHICLQ